MADPEEPGEWEWEDEDEDEDEESEGSPFERRFAEQRFDPALQDRAARARARFFGRDPLSEEDDEDDEPRPESTEERVDRLMNRRVKISNRSWRRLLMAAFRNSG